MVFDRNLKWTFDKTARKRMSFSEDYPIELFQSIQSFADLKEGKKMLEVGCGTGIATLPFAKMGLDITAIDISDNSIWQAKGRTNAFPNVNYIHGSFEETNLPKNSFDIIAAAQSWHWLDPTIAYQKAHTLLKEEGTLALFWKFQDSHKSPLVREINTIFSKHCDKYPSDFGSTSPTEDRLSRSGCFDKYTKIEYSQQKDITKRELYCLLRAYSWVNDLSTSKSMRAFSNDISKLLESEQETISLPYRYVLLMSRKK